RVSLAFIGQGAMLARIIHEGFIDREIIGEIAPGLWGTVQHGLHQLVAALQDDTPAHNAARGAVYVGDEVDFVFLLPTKVNSSSSSLTSNTSWLGSGAWSGKLCA